MLRVIQQSSSEAAKKYYSRSDYLSEGQELVGNWGGKGAERLGLKGIAGKEQFDMLCDNIDPRTGQRLTARTNNERTCGYDLTFSVPKSVSLLYEMTEDKELFTAFREAVDETMRDVEAEMKTRVRKGGKEANRLTGNGVWATFYHFTSRPVDGVPDPQLHAHNFVFNSTFDNEEKRWKAGQFRDIKRDAPYFQAMFRARLANRVQELGYAVERKKDDFEIAGVDRDMLKRFSRRTDKIEKTYNDILAKRMAELGEGEFRQGRFEVEGKPLSPQEILAKAEELGIGGPQLKDSLGESTRELKNHTFTLQQLRDEWDGRLTEKERETLQNVAARRSGPIAAERGEKAAVDHALLHCFERESVVRVKELQAEALRFGLGRVSVKNIEDELARRKLIVVEVDGDRLCTTPEIIAEEQRLIRFARNGRGTAAALAGFDRAFRRENLNEQQQRAVRHLWESPDRVMLMRGAAGTGKTTLLQEAVEGIEKNGRHVVVLAPSAEASRGVLRSQGFAAADTVAKFLEDRELQLSARGGVILIDEASLIGTRTLAKVVGIVEDLKARLILVGDPKQHVSVERGTAFRLLAETAALPVVEVTDIIRQERGEYKQAVQALSDGRTSEGLTALDQLGWVREAGGGEREKLLASDYLAALAEKKPDGKFKTALVVSPTHAEAANITEAIRAAMREKGLLGEERKFAVWTSANLTEAERQDRDNYSAGDMLRFHKACPGHQNGERLVVAEGKALPLNQADRFQVYHPAELAIAVGDKLRVTANGKTRNGHRLNNGSLLTVKGFTARGDLVDDRGWIIDRHFGHLAQGYVLTSFASQGKTVDKVFVGQSSASGRAASAAQFYVSASRAKEAVTIYTDDKAALRQAIQGDAPRLSATELARQARRLRRQLALIRNRCKVERSRETPTTGVRIQSLNKDTEREHER